jgi:hypothetical protein
MATNNDGEFELVLGNKQLLSVFFIVAVLIAVFFTMGYIVGRNSAPGFASADSGARKPAEKVSDANRPSATGQAPSSTQTSLPTVDSGPVGAAATDNPGSRPAAGGNAAAPSESKGDAASKSEDTSQPAPAPEMPAPGTYLQVIAVPRTEAEIMVEALGKKGFHALFVPSEAKPGYYGVLVGPLADRAAIGQTRTDLVKAGFKGYEAFIKKF